MSQSKHSDDHEISRVIREMKRAYDRGDNAMATARKLLGNSENLSVATLIAYDLQAGSYVALAKENPQLRETMIQWSCPITRSGLRDAKDVFLSDDTGLIYPVLRGIPLLRPQHAIVASGLVKESNIIS